VSAIYSICSNFSDKQKQLLDACEQLVFEGHQMPLGYALVAQHAGMRLSNCYRYFRSEQEMSAALALRLFAEHLDFRPCHDSRQIKSWPELLRQRIESGQRVFNSKSVAAEVLLNWYVIYCANTVSFAGISLSTLLGDERMAQFAQYFDMSDQSSELFDRLVATQWSLSCLHFQRDGYISDAAVEDVFNHSVSYLGNYMSISLPRRKDAVVED